MESKIYKCACGCGGVELSAWTDIDGTVINIDFLKRTHRHKIFSERVKQVWRLLRYGFYYDDDIVLSLETAKKIGHELIRMAMEKK
jgi:hypothetical protein